MNERSEPGSGSLDDRTRVAELLDDATTYMENRLALVDGKAPLMMAVVGGLFASLVFVVGDLPALKAWESWESVVYLFLIGELIVGGRGVMLLLQTIRPTKGFLGKRVGLRHPGVKPYFMWPNPDFPGTFESYRDAVDLITPTVDFDNRIARSYVVLQLVQAKYHHYRKAMWWIKLLALWTGVGIFVIGLLRALRWV